MLASDADAKTGVFPAGQYLYQVQIYSTSAAVAASSFKEHWQAINPLLVIPISCNILIRLDTALESSFPT